MLKIRITGSKDELQQVAQEMSDGKIRKYRQPNGKTTFAIDTSIRVEDFLSKNKPTENTNDMKEIQQELNDILNIIE